MYKFNTFTPTDELGHLLMECPSYHKGFYVLTAKVTKSSVYWDITPRNPLKSQLMFWRNISPPFLGLKSSQARNQHEAGSKFLAWLTLQS
jgi:hypothetical protein